MTLMGVSLVLEIAGLRLHLTVPTPTVAEALRRRWGAFVLTTATPRMVPTQAAAPAWHAQVEVLPRPPAEAGASLLTVPLTFAPQRVAWHTPAGGVTGYLALDVGKAVLTTPALHVLDEIEYLVRLCYIYLTYLAGGVVLHGAGLVRDGGGYVFLGLSGAGKTTVARVSLAAGLAEVLNDDLLVAHPTPNGWWVYGTPFGNPTQMPAQPPRAAPLRALFRLRQAKQVAAHPLSPAVAVAEVLANLPVLNQDPHRLPTVLGYVQRLIAAFPVQQLNFLPDTSFWDVVVKREP